MRQPNTSEADIAKIIAKNRDLFKNKNADYGSSWTILRYSKSFTDQIFIKAQRIRTIQDTKQNLVGDPIEGEFIGIFNYSVMGLMKKFNTVEVDASTPLDKLLKRYDEQVESIKKLREKKNHDYGEAWREMRISSITDMILMKLLRIRQIETNAGATLVSEPIEAGYQDIANYAVFALILISEKQNPLV